MTKYLLKNCDIADFDTLGTLRRDILIEGDRIASIAECIEQTPDVDVINAKGMLAMPGFVDSHTHLYQTFFKGPMDDYPITEWLVRLFTFEGEMDDEISYYSYLLGCLSALRFGTTTVNDMGNWSSFGPAIQAIKDSNIRATYGISTTDIAENEVTPIIPVDQALAYSDHIYKTIHGQNGGLLRASVAPAGLPACSKAMVQALKAFADERGLVFHTHLGEGKKETIDVMNMYNLRGEGEALYEFGILGPRTLLAHSIWLEDFELDLIKEKDATPVHCPNTNMKISDGIAKIALMNKKGVNVAFGCDGEASSSTRDMIREGRAGAYLQKAITLDPIVMDAGTVFKMMTQNGARALGYEDIGELKEGYKADLILVDMDNDLSLVNPDYRVGNLLYAGDGHAVDTVFCNGSLMVRGGHLTQFDEQELLAKCREQVSRLNKKIAAL